MRATTSNKHPVSTQISKLGHICPNRIALSAGECQLTYRELNRRADRFASYLAERGVTTGDAVAICMERSFEWIVAALGIMRAGAAYVPLDSAWPDSRVRLAVRDSRAVALVVRAFRFDRLQIGIRAIDPLRDAAAIAGSRLKRLAPIEPESLAYFHDV